MVDASINKCINMEAGNSVTSLPFNSIFYEEIKASSTASWARG